MKHDKLVIAIFVLFAIFAFTVTFLIMTPLYYNDTTPVVVTEPVVVHQLPAETVVLKSATVVANKATPVQEKKPAKKPAKKTYVVYGVKFQSEETAATFKAEMNALRADCLREIVDNKARYDISRGVINDWGSAIDAPVCQFNNL